MLHLLPIVLLLLSCSKRVVAPQSLENNYSYRPKTAKEYRRKGLIPLEDFFKKNEVATVRLSPNGKYLAYLKYHGEHYNIFTKRVDGKGKETQITKETERDAGIFFWKGEETLVIFKYLKNEGVTHIFRTSATGKKEKNITPKKGVSFSFVHDSPTTPRQIIIRSDERSWQFRDVYRLNTHTGQMKLVLKDSKGFSSFLFDGRDKLRMAITGGMKTFGLHHHIYYRAKENRPMKKLSTVHFTDSHTPIGFTPDNKNIYFLSNRGRDTIALQIFDPRRKKVIRTLWKHPTRNIAGVTYSTYRKKLLYAYYQTEKGMEKKFFDSKIKKIYQDLKGLFPSPKVFFTSARSRNEETFVVYSYSDRDSGSYYTYRPKEKKLTLLAKTRPWMDESKLSPMKPIQYTSRDGLVIEGYLTLPKGKGKKNLPFVLLPHGGPWTRDNWGLHPQVQFLASRGYGVLQMNYRGSTNWGKKFWMASFKQFGQKMQDDISDGVKFIVEKGLADKNRICIFGASYGGYATLAGLAFTPKLYRCGVNLVGVSNLFTQLNSPYWYSAKKKMASMVGDVEKDREMLKRVSPLFHADKINAPLLIAHGAKDPLVEKSESDKIVLSLRKRGLAPIYMVKYDEGHGFYKEKNVMEFYSVMEEFLAKNLLVQ